MRPLVDAVLDAHHVASLDVRHHKVTAHCLGHSVWLTSQRIIGLVDVGQAVLLHRGTAIVV